MCSMRSARSPILPGEWPLRSLVSSLVHSKRDCKASIAGCDQQAKAAACCLLCRTCGGGGAGLEPASAERGRLFHSLINQSRSRGSLVLIAKLI